MSAVKVLNRWESSQQTKLSQKTISISAFVSCAVRRGDVLAAWSGIRPLVTDPNSKDTQSICRNHIVSISDSGLVTIAGQSAFSVRM